MVTVRSQLVTRSVEAWMNDGVLTASAFAADMMGWAYGGAMLHRKVDPEGLNINAVKAGRRIAVP